LARLARPSRHQGDPALSDQTDTSRYLVISSDTHAGPPAERYRDYLDPKYRPAFDEDLKMVKEMNRARSAMTEAGDFEAKWEAETGDGGRRASWDPAARDAELDKEGVAAEVIFPDADVLAGAASAPFHAGLGSAGDLDGELVMAGAVAHNRWLEELCSSSPERRCGVATVPILHDIEAAVAEIERLATAGFRAIMIPTVWVDKPSYNDLRYKPVWSACESHGMVVHVHSGGASRDIAVDAPGLIAIYATEAWWWAARPLWVMLWGGVFERHPGLRFAITHGREVRRRPQYGEDGERVPPDHLAEAERVLRHEHLRRRLDPEPRGGRAATPDRDRGLHVGQ
jgi:predicted TIM-barrel fold metal-dependent hydrolase